jgi:hypothetical protein
MLYRFISLYVFLTLYNILDIIIIISEDNMKFFCSYKIQNLTGRKRTENIFIFTTSFFLQNLKTYGICHPCAV